MISIQSRIRGIGRDFMGRGLDMLRHVNVNSETCEEEKSDVLGWLKKQTSTLCSFHSAGLGTSSAEDN